MADINALYEELTRFYFNKGPSSQLNAPVGAWRALEASEFFVPGGGGLRFLLDFARSEECRGVINSDEVLARVVKQMDAAIVEISAVRDIARKYLPADAENPVAEGEYMYNAKGEKVCASNSGDADDPFRRSVMRKFTRKDDVSLNTCIVTLLTEALEARRVFPPIHERKSEQRQSLSD